jgi:hypothetical protein
MNEVLKLIQGLRRDEIDARLVELDTETKALLALRRSVSARDRARRRQAADGASKPTPTTTPEGGDRSAKPKPATKARGFSTQGAQQ